MKRAEIALLDLLVVGLGFQNTARQKELLGQLLVPLLAQIGGNYCKDTPSAFRPSLRNHQAGLNRFTQPDFVSQDCPLRERRPEGKQSGFYLVRVQVYLGIHESAGELLHAVDWAALRQLEGVVFRVVGRQVQ